MSKPIMLLIVFVGRYEDALIHAFCPKEYSHTSHIYGVMALKGFHRIIFSDFVVLIFVVGFYTDLRMAMIVDSLSLRLKGR